MANTTSGTTTFEKGFSISDIVEEAYERLGIQGVSGYQLKSARRSLNILFQEWANRGLHYWEVANNSITLVADQATYTMFRSTADGTSDATALGSSEPMWWSGMSCSASVPISGRLRMSTNGAALAAIIIGSVTGCLSCNGLLAVLIGVPSPCIGDCGGAHLIRHCWIIQDCSSNWT